MAAKARLGLVGGRGYVGREIVRLVQKHPHLELGFVASSTQAGELVASAIEEAPAGMRFELATPDAIAKLDADVLVLALPNGLAPPMVAAVEAAGKSSVVVDVSADYRFDSAWVWGVPELGREKLRGAKRIANPGCYATAAAIALAPIAALLEGPAHAFGVSGYSGAGTTPSPRNDPEKLRDGVIPYGLVDHVHEREVTRHVGPVFLIPHVAPFFRGISMTLSFTLKEATTVEALRGLYEARYRGEKLVRIGEGIPRVQDAVGRCDVEVGGFALGPGGRHGVVVSTLDNLLKGAASQAMQNVNLALGFGELEGIR